jgi:hypothetical protein
VGRPPSCSSTRRRQRCSRGPAAQSMHTSYHFRPGRPGGLAPGTTCGKDVAARRPARPFPYPTRDHPEGSAGLAQDDELADFPCGVQVDFALTAFCEVSTGARWMAG